MARRAPPRPNKTAFRSPVDPSNSTALTAPRTPQRPTTRVTTPSRHGSTSRRRAPSAQSPNPLLASPAVDVIGGMSTNKPFHKQTRCWDSFLRFFSFQTVCNLICLSITLAGIWLRMEYSKSEERWLQIVAKMTFTVGIFSLSGGVTNAIAIKMLFDRIYLMPRLSLPGSGIIPENFQSIRTSIKRMVMAMFFTPQFLQYYINKKAGELTSSLQLDTRLRQLLEQDSIDKIIGQKLAELNARPEGLAFRMMGITTEQLKPALKPFLVSFVCDLGE
ncbi:hypothetical protein KIPB_001886 [Kipferlia bialata]|uniref:Uncharacterized protein n=1 Tax=Kipferlia bialata TaxID=797122 RepID=A0A9K3CRL4_9EUKA|nr:hypothetical protein KIPB_001885 [Kipferlia bialata]GIQ80995.1 hypothetical protein KIPB_001886 [Kipferlia bialata]|eukprot:g1885.t1